MTANLNRRSFFKTTALGAAALAVPRGLWAANGTGGGRKKPNFVIIFIDDMGYGDIEPFGSQKNRTPHLNRMAAEGMKWTDFYVASTACTPSRAALLTGCYADRVAMDGRVCFPGEARGLNPSEITLAEMLKQAGYATGCFGKWHLGDQPQFLPTRRGFDEYLGIPYSNDMWSPRYPPLPLIKQEEPVAWVQDGPDQALLCKVFTDAAVDFIRRHKDEPFFVYLPHAFIHHPRFARDEFLQRAGGDVTRAQIEEVDWSAGQVLDGLRELGLADNTLVFFTSDNGGSDGTSMGPLRGGKGGPEYEGHKREPTLAWWPGTIPAGAVCHEIGSTIDLYPTFAALAGTNVPQDRIIDGSDIRDLLRGKPGARSPHTLLYYGHGGLRDGKWKLVKSGKGWELYDLETDLGEKHDLADKHPDRVKAMVKQIEAHRADVTSHRRPHGTAANPKPILTQKDTDRVPSVRQYLNLP